MDVLHDSSLPLPLDFMIHVQHEPMTVEDPSGTNDCNPLINSVHLFHYEVINNNNDYEPLC